MATTTLDTASSATSLENVARPWWMMLITGILAFIVGAVLLWAPAKTKVETYQLLVVFLGIYWLIEGLVDIVSMFVDHRAWGWKLFIGIVSILAGGWILMYPVAAGVALPRVFVLVLGIWGLIQGTILLVLAFKGGGWGAGILGVLGILFGLLLIGSYTLLGSGLAFLWAAALFGVVGGIVMIVQSFRVRSA